MIVMVCSPVSASSPPTSSITAATAPVATPQNTTVPRLGLIVPRSDSEPITIDAASAPETKKIATSIITSTLAIVAIGYWSSSAEQLRLDAALAREVDTVLLHVGSRNRRRSRTTPATPGSAPAAHR